MIGKQAGRKIQMAAFLPPNIVIDILARLDVKDLTRYKCVSKAWFHLISSPSFHDLHYSKSQHRLCLLFRSHIDFHNQFGLTYRFYSTTIDGRKPALLSKLIAMVDGPIRNILPSCRGLFCFWTDTGIYVYNPATLRLVTLPPVEYSDTVICGLGFTYICSVKSYVVVRLLFRKSNRRIECSILQLQGGAKASELSWRHIEQACPYFIEDFSIPASVEGKIYWKISRSQTRRRNNDDILCFNIEENKFVVISYPADLRNTAHTWTQLADLDGTLSLVQFSPSNVAIWWRRDRQWHRGGVIDMTGYDGRIFGQINCLKDDEMIFVSFHSSFLLFYNTKTRRFNKMRIPVTVHDLGIYWESLFPLGDSY